MKKKKNITYIILLIVLALCLFLFLRYSRIHTVSADKWQSETINSTDLKYSIDKIVKRKMSIQFTGWAFVDNKIKKRQPPLLIGDNQESRAKQVSALIHRGPIEIGLENIDSKVMYVSKCDKQNREDVGKYFNNPKYNRTGFATTVSRVNIPHGNYKLYFVIKTRDGNKYIQSNNEYKL